MDIADLFKLDRCSGEVGLEVEVEGESLPSPPSLWRMESDGSLKGPGQGIEYVMRYPVLNSDLPSVVKDFSSSFTKSKVNNSIYAGIHVHANVQSFTLRQLITLMTSLICLEEVLVKWCGETREGNHFCLRSSDAEWLIEFIREMIITENPKMMVNNDNIRYSAFNLKSVPLHGSLEFRTLGSTIDPDRILVWTSVIMSIVNNSKFYNNPVEVIQDLKAVGPLEFMKKMMGSYYSFFITPNYQRMIRDGMIRAQEIAYAKDWNSPYNLNIFRSVKEIF